MLLFYKLRKKRSGRCFQILWLFSQYLNFSPSRPFWKKNPATYRNKLERNMFGSDWIRFLRFYLLVFLFYFCLPPRPFLKNIFFAIYLNKLCNSPDWIHFLRFSHQPNFCKFKGLKEMKNSFIASDTSDKMRLLSTASFVHSIRLFFPLKLSSSIC